MTMASTSVEQRLLAAAKKEGRAREAVLAMREYEAEKLRVDANTVRLRAIRLAKQAAEALVPAEQPAAKKKMTSRKPTSIRVTRVTTTA